MQKAAYRTKQQELLLTYLRETKGTHFTAEDVRFHFQQKQIPIGLATIYRQLEKLVADGKIQKYFIDEHSATCFEYTGEECMKSLQHFHLKCEDCGCLLHLECDELAEVSSHLLEEHGFSVDPFRTVLYGRCADCAEKARTENPPNI